MRSHLNTWNKLLQSSESSCYNLQSLAASPQTPRLTPTAAVLVPAAQTPTLPLLEGAPPHKACPSLQEQLAPRCWKLF